MRSGSLRPGDRLLPERRIAEKFNVSIRPVRMAMDKYISQGILEKVQGRGTFLKKLPFDDAKKTNTVGLVYPHSRAGFYASSFYASILSGIEAELAREGKKQIAVSLPDQYGADPERALAELEADVDGFIVIGVLPSQISALGRAVRKCAKPVTVLDCETDIPGTDSIVFDSRENAFRITEFLIRNGHRRIAFFHKRSFYYENAMDPNMQLRLDGYRDALEAAGIPADPELVRCLELRFVQESMLGQYYSIIDRNSDTYERYSQSFRQCRENLRAVLELPAPPTAVVCAGDDLAFPVYVTARALDVRIPRDISVVGYNDIVEAGLLDPALTTVKTPQQEMGVRAVARLRERLDEMDRGERSYKKTVLPGTVIKRRSHRTIS